MENFPFALVETARVMRRDFDRRAAALGVTRAQGRVLGQLSLMDGARQVDLADALDIEPITLCRMIDRLEGGGLVERRRNLEDRRAWNLYLTEKSRPLIAQLELLADKFSRDVLAGISGPALEGAAEVLARVRANIAGSEGSNQTILNEGSTLQPIAL